MRPKLSNRSYTAHLRVAAEFLACLSYVFASPVARADENPVEESSTLYLFGAGKEPDRATPYIQSVCELIAENHRLRSRFPHVFTYHQSISHHVTPSIDEYLKNNTVSDIIKDTIARGLDIVHQIDRNAPFCVGGPQSQQTTGLLREMPQTVIALEWISETDTHDSFRVWLGVSKEEAVQSAAKPSLRLPKSDLRIAAGMTIFYAGLIEDPLKDSTWVRLDIDTDDYCGEGETQDCLLLGSSATGSIIINSYLFPAEAFEIGRGDLWCPYTKGRERGMRSDCGTFSRVSAPGDKAASSAQIAHKFRITPFRNRGRYELNVTLRLKADHEISSFVSHAFMVKPTSILITHPEGGGDDAQRVDEVSTLIRSTHIIPFVRAQVGTADLTNLFSRFEVADAEGIMEASDFLDRRIQRLKPPVADQDRAAYSAIVHNFTERRRLIFQRSEDLDTSSIAEEVCTPILDELSIGTPHLVLFGRQANSWLHDCKTAITEAKERLTRSHPSTFFWAPNYFPNDTAFPLTRERDGLTCCAINSTASVALSAEQLRDDRRDIISIIAKDTNKNRSRRVQWTVNWLSSPDIRVAIGRFIRWRPSEIAPQNPNPGFGFAYEFSAPAIFDLIEARVTMMPTGFVLAPEPDPFTIGEHGFTLLIGGRLQLLNLVDLVEDGVSNHFWPHRIQASIGSGYDLYGNRWFGSGLIGYELSLTSIFADVSFDGTGPGIYARASGEFVWYEDIRYSLVAIMFGLGLSL